MLGDRYVSDKGALGIRIPWVRGRFSSSRVKLRNPMFHSFGFNPLPLSGHLPNLAEIIQAAC